MAACQRADWGLWLHWAWLPIVGWAVGMALIFSLLGIWLHQGHPRYESDNGTVVFVSDVGAANHALFIVLCTLTGVLFFLSIAADFWLRHKARLPGRVRRKERISMGISFLFAFFTMVFVILLSIFDAFHHSSLHWPFAVIFFICLVISAVFNMVQIAHLARSYPARRHLKYSFFAKLFLICTGVCAIIAIAGLYGYCESVTPDGVDESQDCNGPYSGVAALEWFILLVFAFYILSIVLDLYPSRRTSRHVPGGAKGGHDLEMGPPVGQVNGGMGHASGGMGQPNGAAATGLSGANVHSWQHPQHPNGAAMQPTAEDAGPPAAYGYMN